MNWRRRSQQIHSPKRMPSRKTLHLYFLREIPQDPDLAKLDEIKKESERFHLDGQVFYLYTPDGFGRSKLAERVERTLGVAATARNWRSVGEDYGDRAAICTITTN